MNAEQFTRCLELLSTLSLGKQADCIRIAAARTQPLWLAWWLEHNLPDHSERLLRIFDLWFAEKATDEDVHDDVVSIALHYAAAAHAGMDGEPLARPSGLDAGELEFLDQWWRSCGERYPGLERPLRSSATGSSCCNT